MIGSGILIPLLATLLVGFVGDCLFKAFRLVVVLLIQALLVIMFTMYATQGGALNGHWFIGTLVMLVNFLVLLTLSQRMKREEEALVLPALATLMVSRLAKQTSDSINE
jgi:hypothetical protein